jgi:hypothetical protein
VVVRFAEPALPPVADAESLWVKAAASLLGPAEELASQWVAALELVWQWGRELELAQALGSG